MRIFMGVISRMRPESLRFDRTMARFGAAGKVPADVQDCGRAV
jgi:hypothetical protein